MIVFGMVAEVSIGKLFVAGVIPGLLLALIYSIGIVIMSLAKPELVGGFRYSPIPATNSHKTQEAISFMIKPLPVVALIIVVLGGIWGGFFTPTEASAIGALGALLLALSKGMGKKGVKESILETAATTSTILFLLIAAQMYSRMLTMSGVVNWIGNIVVNLQVSPYIILFLFIILWIILGCLLDSTSILLITVPLMAPIAKQLGFDLVWFGIVTIITVEMGLLTPPFGMVVFAVKATLGEMATIEEIFAGAIPFLFMMGIALVIVIAFPILSTWLPSLM
jgi:tripartite ATP-independent transporter DctM subunit